MLPEPGANRFDPIVYLQRMPQHWLQHRPPCPNDECPGWLACEPDGHGYGDMFMCVGGCGARFFVEFD